MALLPKLFFRIILLGFCVGVACSDSVAQKKPKKFGYHFTGSRQKVAKVPFDISANLIIIKITVDNSDTLNFILDTGVSSIIVTEPRVASQLNLTFVREVQLTGAGEGEPLRAGVSVNHQLRMKNVEAHQQNLVVLNEDILQLSEFLGMPIHGIFGHDLFNRFVVTIDFVNRELVLTEPSKFKYRKQMGDKFPIIITQSKPYTEAITLEDEGEMKTMKLVIDTGAGHALMLNANGKSDRINLPNHVIRANLGRGLNGEINGMLGRVNRVKMGRSELQNVLASYPDSLSFSMKFPPTDYDRHGSIGCELLRRFRVTLNYADGYMILKPIKNRVNEAFEHDMSGLVIKAKGDNLDQYVIESVINGSPADKAGLRDGDEIVFFNSQKVSDLSLNEIYRTLSKKAGKEIELFVRRKGQLQFHYFILERVI